MKERIVYFIAIAVLTVLLFNKKIEKEYYETLIPEKYGYFKGFDPIPIPKVGNILIYKQEVVAHDTTVNDSLYKMYVDSNDEVERLKMYIKSVTKNTYHEVFEDGVVTIDFKSEVTGTLDFYELEYKVKEVVVPNNSYINVGGKLEVDGKGLNYKVGAEFINKNKNTINLYFNKESISLGASLNILKI